MAHAYTTSRGKNKKAKLNKRMDKAQNSERSLKKTVVDTKFDGPKTNVFTIGRISGGNNSSSSSSRAIIDPRQAAIAAINPPILKCNNPNCKKKTISKLSQCSGCELVSYCTVTHSLLMIFIYSLTHSLTLKVDEIVKLKTGKHIKQSASNNKCNQKS